MESKARFRVGDKVLIKKPNKPEEYPTWVEDMDKYHNTVQTIETVVVDVPTFIYFIKVGDDWSYAERWLYHATDLGKALYE